VLFWVQVGGQQNTKVKNEWSYNLLLIYAVIASCIFIVTARNKII
jgi:hypothetical protein